MPNEVVLDASALLAMLRREPGGDRVADLRAGAAISAVNLAEVVTVLVRRGVPLPRVREALDPLDLDVRPFDLDDAYSTAELAPKTHAVGLSLGDRACLMLAKRLGRPAVTADRSWRELKLGVKVVLVR
jgi:PIN domain nuclease of toxin-antitoxin system